MIKKYHIVNIYFLIVFFLNCGVNNPKINVNKEYFLGNWESRHHLKKIEFNKTNANWFINYKNDTSVTFNKDLIDSSMYDSYDSNYLLMHYKGWELHVNENKINFLDTFTMSPGKIANGITTFYFTIISEDSFYLNGCNYSSILLIRN